MKKIISILLVIFISGTILTGCGKPALTDMVDSYDFRGVEDGTILWEVYFNDDYKPSEYDYSDFIDVIKDCMSRSGQYSFSDAWVLAFDSDGITNRFSWNSSENPYIIEQKDGTIPNLREYEWNLTTDEVNEIWDSIGNMAPENEKENNVETEENNIPENQPVEMTLDLSFGIRTGDYYGETNDEGIPNGEGTFSSVNDAGIKWTYTGEWDNGHWNSSGKQSWEDGTIYEGEFLNDKFNGYGEHTFSSGDIYKGNFEDGNLYGEGTLYFADGAYFDGVFTDEHNATGQFYDENGLCHDASMIDGSIYDAEN